MGAGGHYFAFNRVRLLNTVPSAGPGAQLGVTKGRVWVPGCSPRAEAAFHWDTWNSPI